MRIGEKKRPNRARLSEMLTHWEILSRAKADLMRELEALERQAEAEGLPDACYAEERRALGLKISTINAMIYYETGKN